MELIWLMLIASNIIQILLFIPAFIFKTDKLTDLSYSMTFILLSIIAFVFSTKTFEHLVIMVMVILWGLRLGYYLFNRIIKMKIDHRFDDFRDSFFKFLGFWVIQGVTVWVVLIPLFLFMALPIPALNWWGIYIFLIGLWIEAIADQQKFNFKSTGQKGFIQSGLWKYSRHPNYFGEMLVWVGVYLSIASALSIGEAVIGLISPLFIISLLLFFSGIPPLERSHLKKYGKAYKEYQLSTSLLIPMPKKKPNHLNR
ncbi:DUF1295 domain-containing protein [Candidatus Woesearchaeota archaeon]|nr:DUF1295 domain-containing protein [Candidatus Woesearchaeota archaeon]